MILASKYSTGSDTGPETPHRELPDCAAAAMLARRHASTSLICSFSLTVFAASDSFLYLKFPGDAVWPPLERRQKRLGAKRLSP